MTGYPAARPAWAGTTRDGGQLAGLTQALGVGAERLLIGASVYREPADRNALLFQVGLHDWTATGAPGRQDAAPPYQEPPDLGDMIAACEAAGLLTVGFVAPNGPAPTGRPGADQPDLPTLFVDRWTASELHRALEAANRGHDLAAAHLRAAEYWRWRSAASPQDRRADLHDLLEARHHLLKAGETEQACELTEAVCSQLHAWGDLGREAALISDTLTWLPAGSALSAAWIHELGTIAQVRADYAEAERCYKRALEIFATVGDLSGVSRGHHSLGVLAQAQGDYARAELRYQAAEATEPATASPPSQNAAPPEPPSAASPSQPPAPAQPGTPAHAEPGTAAPPEPRTVAPPEPRTAAPAEPRPAAPAEPATAGSGTAAPTEPRDAAPVEPGTAAPAEPRPAAPAEPGTAGSGTAAPTGPRDAAPVEPGMAAPAMPRADGPAIPPPAALATPGTASPAEPRAALPAEPGRAAPAEPGDANLAEPGDAPAPPPTGAPAVPRRAEAAMPVTTVSAVPRTVPPARSRTVSPVSPQAAAPATPKHASAFARPGRPTWWRMPGLTAVSVALLALSVAGITGVFPSAGGASLSTPGAMTAAAAVSQAAAAWVAGQVSRSAIVSCDPAMCAELQAKGVPAADLLVLGPAAPDPLGSDVVVATTALRSEFGNRLADVYAPVVLASFGSGGGRVDIRVVAPDGATAYRNALAADLAARRSAGAELLGNPRLTAPTPTRRQLAEGLVDSRLLATLATLTDQYPVRILSFGEPAPGASAGVPLRSAEIAAPAAKGANAKRRSRGTGRDPGAAYVRSVVGFLRAQRIPFLATDIRAIQMPGGQAVILVGFASPSPLGLLSRSPAM